MERAGHKTIRGIDLTVAGVTATASQIVFRPAVGTKYIVTGVYTENRSVTGTVSDAPNILLDNGTDASNIVAGVDLATTQGAVKVHTLASTTLTIDHSNPLRLKSVDGADGATAFLVDLTIRVFQLDPYT